MKIAILSNPQKGRVVEVVKKILQKFLKKKGVQFFLDKHLSQALRCKELYRTDEMIQKSADLLVVLGGDGTLLHAVKRIKKPDLPILGVNLGGIGFLTDFTPDDFLKAFPEILKKNFELDPRLMLQVTYFRRQKSLGVYEVLNDVVMTKGALSRMLTLQVFINGNDLTTYKSDGLIVATPTGSTAHSLSSGGPIVAPNCDVMILTPICPHTLSNRPLVLSCHQKIRIELVSSSEMVGLTFDGQLGVEFKEGDAILIERSQRTIPLVRYRSHYFEILREKLGWRGTMGS
ncbi:MAG: NAD(+)/NADH kinase [Chlamydiae bacterium]|nr:NAD(+)/NADH kinase [Chlamydiota bacterium]MBI3278093.1 NAD(+)/NADH kinase [Chlamydiota bacterium]